jgi:hypothetical protein
MKRKGVMKLLAALLLVAVLGSSMSGCAVVPLIPGAAGVFYGAAKETETYLSGKGEEKEGSETKAPTTEGGTAQASGKDSPK